MSNQSSGGQPPTGADHFSRSGFIFAAIGSAVGLGNMWKFPYITGKYGGAAFFLLFVIFLVLVGLPVLLAEMTIGRGGRGSAYTSFRNLSKVKVWGTFGFLAILGAFMILSFYGVVAGWTLHYAFLSFTGSLFSSSDYGGTFASFSGSYVPVFWLLVVMVLTGWVVARGISGGIEKFNKILIPALLVILLVLMGRALTLPGAMEGVRFFLKPDFSKLTAESALVALGHAFFSLSLGMGTMLTYGAYVDRRQSLGGAAAAIGLGDLFYALLAGMIIFPTSAAFALKADQGPSLIFVVLPAAFGAMPYGTFFGGLFFVLLAIAALTSAVSLLEVPVIYAMEKWKLARTKAAWGTAALIFLVGIPSALSVGGPLSRFTLGGKTYFDLLDFAASNVLLPVGGLVVTLFTGYAWKKAGEEAGLTGPLYRIWLFVLRYVAPVMILLIFLYSLGLFG
ncbi:sodium-dependent transporter [Paenibacillus aurantius]|uniref:Transporter n=1 Tax=Paenibacillus aurantius TaxID=2918900 RepID=A0AA96RFX9_9BACL|nr:sodium-dependent transporter [Paenibacillus aurantius]WNQ12477.1 sodium-dependent transporter [Paenibacillus aurantius]